jgi:hypothetical protein
VANGTLIRRGTATGGRPVFRRFGDTAYANSRCAVTGDEVPDMCEDVVDMGRWVTVLLTVAHLEHTPKNCAPENVRCWCQRCHNAYDAPVRAAGRKARRRAEAGDLLAATS